MLCGLGLMVTGTLLAMLSISFFTSQAVYPESSIRISPDRYFPLQVGNQWVYSWTNTLYALSPITETVVVSERIGSQYTLYAYHKQAEGQFKISKTWGYRWVSYNTSGWNISFPLNLYLLLHYLYVPEKLFANSFRAGDAWESVGWYGGEKYDGTTTVITTEAMVTVNGHTFDNCVKIHTIITGSHPFGAGTRDAWFAPDIGLVKLIYNHNDGSITVAELITFSTPLKPQAYLPIVLSDFCTPISIPYDAKLFGVVFFDYNGDGVQQVNEPGIVGAFISIGDKSTLSQCGGLYYFRNIPDGDYSLSITAPGFRYISVSKSEFKKINEPIRINVNDRTEHNIGLMHGFLTIPLHRYTDFYIGEYFDYDPAYYKYLWWNGERGEGPWRNHVGTDFVVYKNGVPVIAASPGIVTSISPDLFSGYCAGVQTSDGTQWGVCHITPTVSVGQILSRGDLMGYINYPDAPHVHLYMGKQKADGWYLFDPFVPLDPSICAEWKWASDNDPIYVKADCSPGYWTVKNSPQYFD